LPFKPRQPLQLKSSACTGCFCIKLYIAYMISSEIIPISRLLRCRHRRLLDHVVFLNVTERRFSDTI
jgi:hypothetical protein